MTKQKKIRKTIKKPKTLSLKPRDYRPSKMELEENIDMPAMSEEELRENFMRPFKSTEQR